MPIHVFYEYQYQKTVHTNARGRTHREDGPAVIVERAFDNSPLTSEYNGPTYIAEEKYFINGKLVFVILAN